MGASFAASESSCLVCQHVACNCSAALTTLHHPHLNVPQHCTITLRPLHCTITLHHHTAPHHCIASLHPECVAVSLCNQPSYYIVTILSLLIIIIIITTTMDTSSRYASQECVSKDFFRHSLDDSQTSYCQLIIIILIARSSMDRKRTFSINTFEWTSRYIYGKQTSRIRIAYNSDSFLYIHSNHTHMQHQQFFLPIFSPHFSLHAYLHISPQFLISRQTRCQTM